MRLRLVENFRALFYLPFYALKERNDAQAEGLEIEWSYANTPGDGVQSVKNGTADVTWGGPMRIMKDQDTEPFGDTSLVGFCEVVSKDPFYLLGRQQLAPFTLSELPSLRLSIVSEVPTPWLCLQSDLAEQGVDVGTYLRTGKIRTDLSFVEQVQALTAGSQDVVQVFEPYVSQLEQAGMSVLAPACERGPTLYTVFVTTHAQLAAKKTQFQALSRAMGRTQQWLHTTDPGAIAEVCAHYFSDIDHDTLKQGIQRYLRDGVWSRSPHINPEGFEVLSHCLYHGGFIQSPGQRATCLSSL